MYISRNIDRELLEKAEKPLLIRGARQVFPLYAVSDFFKGE